MDLKSDNGIFDALILAIANAMSSGASQEQVHSILLEKNWPEDYIFLATKAAEIIYQARVDRQEVQVKLPFRRV